MTVFIGTSGWQYDDWTTPYYSGTPKRQWFEHLLDDFKTVELNVTFYRLPKRDTFTGWYDRSPDDAIITVKASRYITHVRRLSDPAPHVKLLMDRCEPLRGKLGPVLVQLPPDLTVDADGLNAVLRAFPRRVRVAVEPRHESWWSDDVRRCLERHDAALVWADRQGPITPLWRTATFGYARFHEGRSKPWPWYGRQALDTWAERLRELIGADDCYAYFNNDPGCAAVDNAITLAQRLDSRGVETSRVPGKRPVRTR